MLPCGRCMGCRVARLQDWASRILHESRLHKENCFVTLTYDDANLPRPINLNYRDCQLFLYRLRKAIRPKRIRYFICGEYGTKMNRPHYHIVIFGHNFADRNPVRTTTKGAPKYWKSKQLDNLWRKGFTTIGEVNQTTANYVANYCTKKITGQKAEKHYARIDPETGEIYRLEPEFAHMSTRPGLGHDYLLKHYTSIYPGETKGVQHINGQILRNGRKVPAPKYYDKLARRIHPDMHSELHARRKTELVANVMQHTRRRLEDGEKILRARMKLKTRKL